MSENVQMSEKTMGIARIIDQIPIFSDLPTAEVDQLASYFRLKKWATGETLFNEGENSHDLIFVVTGTVSVRKKDKAGQQKEIAKLEGKNVLGEVAFVDKSLRSATAVAISEATGIAMSQEHLDSICDFNPSLAIKLLKKLNRLLSLKLRKTSKEFAEVAASVEK
ncbi:MAG TPA: cyclic nucleotide-binding domain-containing protein [Stenomitos sp.]